MLDAAKALLLGRGHEMAIAQQARGRIGVIGVDAENDH
jgi:hypothetical protein